MRRIQIYLEEAIDDALEAEGVRRGVSKAALIREAVDEKFEPPPRPATGWDALVGRLDGPPVDDIDEFLYGPANNEVR